MGSLPTSVPAEAMWYEILSVEQPIGGKGFKGGKWTMQKKTFIGILALLIAFLAYHKFKTRVVVEGSSIRIDSGAHHIEGTLDPEATYRMIVKDLGVSINTFSGDAFVSVLPLQTAERLRAQFGDFFRCDSPGALPAMQSTLPIVLIADGPQTKAGISEAKSLVKASRIPLVSLTGSRIRVTKQTSMRMNVVDGTGTQLVYVRRLDIQRKDYLQ